MQLRALILMLIMLILVPMVILSANHNVFFIITGLLLLILSMRNIHNYLFKVISEPDETEDELESELKESMDFDVKKFGAGTKVVKNLIIILFFLYCTFYINQLIFKMLLAFIIVYWIRDIMSNVVLKRAGDKEYGVNAVSGLFHLTTNIGTIILIILVAMAKFAGKII